MPLPSAHRHASPGVPQQMMAGISYLHSCHTAHRDLKLDNTLLDGRTPPTIKLVGRDLRFGCQAVTGLVARPGRCRLCKDHSSRIDGAPSRGSASRGGSLSRMPPSVFRGMQGGRARAVARRLSRHPRRLTHRFFLFFSRA